MSSKPHWSHAEIALLQRLAGSVSSREISRRIGRSMKSIRERAYRLGISLRCYGERHYAAKYTDSLIMDIQDEHDSGVGASALARHHNVPRRTIRHFLDGSRGMGYEGDLRRYV